MFDRSRHLGNCFLSGTVTPLILDSQLRWGGDVQNYLLGLNDNSAPLDQPAVVQDNTPRLSAQDIRLLQLRVIEQLRALDDAGILALVPEQARVARTNALRTQIRQNVDTAIRHVIDNPNTPAGNVQFPAGIEPLSVDVITRVRNIHLNNFNRQTQLDSLRDQIVETRLGNQLPSVLRLALRELLTNELNAGNFGPLSRAAFNRASTALQQRIISTLLDFDDRMMAFSSGCPVEPPLNPISGRHVSDELFRAMLRRWRPGEPNQEINFQLPTLANDAIPSPQQFAQFLNALTWQQNANELLVPVHRDNDRLMLAGLINRYNRPGWAQERYSNAEQWQARAQAFVDLETQMRRCADIIVALHRQFPNFPLDGLQGGNPPFPGQIQINNGNITLIRPDLPDNLDLTLANRRQLERCVAWLQHHSTRVNTQLARLFSAESNGANIFMMGDIEPAPNEPRVTNNGRGFNLITFDIDVRQLPDGRYEVTPITRYRNSPWYNYLNRLTDGTVEEQRGNTETLNAGDLVLINRSGNLELVTVENMLNWRTNHITWTNIRDGVTAAIDLSMILMGRVELKAAWMATGQLAARAGMHAARRYMLQTLALRRGGWHLLLGASGVLSSGHWGDPNVSFMGVSGENMRSARHWAFLVDGGLQLMGRPGLGSIGFSRAVSSRMDRIIANSSWMRNTQHVAELDALRFLTFGRLSTGRYVQPTLMVGMCFAGIFGMLRDGRPTHQGNLNLDQLADNMPQTVLLERSEHQLLANAGLNQQEIARLLGIVADNRPNQNPPQRRLNVEQQLITEFNRQGASDRDRLAAALLLLLEAGRNSPDGIIPPQLGEAGTSITSQSVRDFILGRFNNSQNPEIRLQAAQALLATEQLTPQEFTNFCMTLARDNNLARNIRAQATMAVGLSMMMANVAETELVRRIHAGEVHSDAAEAYLRDNFNVTRQDLRNCLQTIASTAGGNNDIRALCAALINASEQGTFEQALASFQSLAASWHNTRNQPAGTFAAPLLAQWSRELSLPIDSDIPDAARNSRRVFNAARALRWLSDPTQQLSIVSGLFANSPDAGLLRGIQPLSSLNPGRAHFPQEINNALISCVNAAQPEIAIQALTQLVSSLSNLNQTQITTLRANARLLLARLALPDQGYRPNQRDAISIDAVAGLVHPLGFNVSGVDQTLTRQSEHEQLIRTLCRRRLIELLPSLFADAATPDINMLLPQLAATLVPQVDAMRRTDTPELRQAAAVAMGLLMAGRPTARFFLGNQTNTIVADTIQGLSPHPHRFLANNINQLLVQSDPTPLAQLESALNDASPQVRIAAVEALLQVRPALLSNGRTLQQLCADLLITETDPAVLGALRRAEFLQRAPDPTSPDYMDDFQRARYDLISSLNCRGERSLSGVPEFLFNPAHNLTSTDQWRPNGAQYAPYNQPYHQLNFSDGLFHMANGNGPHAMDALKAMVYIIITRGRPFELRMSQGFAIDRAVGQLRALSDGLNVAANPERAQDVLWALELCLVLHTNLHTVQRRGLLNAYMRIVQELPANAQRHHRAGVVAAIVLERAAVSWYPSDEERTRIDLLQDCVRHLGTYRTRAALPVLELITRGDGPAPVREAAQARLQDLRSDANVVAPGTRGGALPGTVAFDDAYDTLRRQLLDGTNGLLVQPGLPEQRRFGWVIQDPTEAPGRTPRQRELLLAFANESWTYRERIRRYAPNIYYIWWRGPARLGTEPRTPGGTPRNAMNELLALARRNGSNAQGTRRQEELDAQSEARMFLAWIVAVNGEGLAHALRDDFVRDAAACLSDLAQNQMPGLADLDAVIESALVGQPLLPREVRNHLITALWNRRATNRGSIANERVALILAGCLRSEFQTMPRPNEPEFAASRAMQIRILEYLEQLGHRMCAPVVQALAMYHPVPEVRTRAQQTVLALHDNVWRVWNRTTPDTTTLPAARATTLRNALSGNGTHDGIVQAIFNAYRGRPIVANDPRHQAFLEGLSDTRPHVRLACAFVVLRSENTAFSQIDRQSAMRIAADTALNGVHIGLRQSASQILLENLAVGNYTVEPVPGRTIQIFRTAQGMSLVESVNGRPTLVQLPNGGIRRYIYDNENRLSRYQTETGAEFSVIQRNGNQLIWTDGDRFQFVSPNEITPATALERGMPFRFSRIAYPGGGLFREFRYDGDTLVYLNEGGTIYERIREGNTYIDLWRRNGSSTDLWLGPMNVASDGTFTEYRHSYLSNRSITPDGTNQWTPATQTLNLGSGQLLTVQSDGRHSLTVNGRQPLHPITLPGRLHYQQWETGGSVLRNDSGLCYPIVFTYPEGSEVLYRRFDCRDGVVQSMTFRRRGDSAPTVVTREGRHTYRVVGPGVNRLYRDCQISAGANGEFSWTLGEDFRVESQDIRTGAITLRSTF